ncbi:MAG: ATP-dependent DNA helicase [Burkholderiales bacterium]|nr:ATP-dependent DNA helicase [Burkholderiales bacterium]
MTDPIDYAFAPDGPLARAVTAYRPRRGQVGLAKAVDAALRDYGVLVAEAGTGTGKTFAYLVPALLSQAKVIISTGTKTLQDQLYDRDIPTVRSALHVPVSVAVLKGRANYVCHHHLERARTEGRFTSRDSARHLHAIAAFALRSNTGDKSELAEVPEEAAIWMHVTSTRENCLGSECPRYRDCFVMEARRRAMEADVVVVNHHLFFADVVLRDQGAGELLPASNAVILDEAHQLPETASLFFGESVSTAQLLELARDAQSAAIAHARDFAPLPQAVPALEKAARELRLECGEVPGRVAANAMSASDAFQAALGCALDALGVLHERLTVQAERHPDIDNCRQRALDLLERLQRWRDGDSAQHVRWIEVYTQSAALNATPLSVAPTFRRQLDAGQRAWIFTSATLSVGADFSHFCTRMGLDDAATARWESPFDFERQALLYLPPSLPDPNTQAYTAAVVDAALPVLRASGARAFCLFTSLRAMREAHRLLSEAFAREGWDYPLLVQGQGSRSELLERFRSLGNAVLVGSHSFWEGVDVRGEALSVVVIDRIPFSPPDDPVLAARIQALEREGGSGFLDYQLPAAALTLKQGVGRLIRDESDRGVMMLCDPRLLSRGYGRRILASLPPMRRTRAIADVEAFFKTPNH